MNELYPERWRLPPVIAWNRPVPFGLPDIPNYRYAFHFWRNLHKEFEPLSRRCSIRRFVNPVALLPGRARLSTIPSPTGSTAFANTIGTDRLALCTAWTALAPEAKMTSGVSATNSAACLRYNSRSPALQRMSMRTLRPTDQPASCKPCRNAASRAWPSSSSAAKFIITPTRRVPSDCCACAASDQLVAKPVIPLMKSRRRITSPKGSRSALTLAYNAGLEQGFMTRKMGSGVALHSSNFGMLMSAPGQSRHFGRGFGLPLYPVRPDRCVALSHAAAGWQRASVQKRV